MKIDITGHHTFVTDALRERVEKSLKNMDNNAHAPIDYVHVVIDIDGRQHHCSIKLTNRFGTYVADDRSHDMYASITRSLHKLARQINAAHAHRAKHH